MARSATMEAEQRRISWGAIFGGVAIALVIQLVLSLLGIGLGASTVSPATEENPMEGLGTASFIWLGLTALVGLYAGGWVSGRLAGEPRRTDGLLHGLLTWSLTTLLAFYLVTTAVGSLIGGAVGVAGRLVSAVGSGVSNIAPEVMEGARAQLGNIPGLDISNIRQEAETLLRQTGKPELQPENLQREAQQAGREAQGGAAQAGKAPQQADQEFGAIFDRVFSGVSRTASAADKEALINVLVARTNMPRQEAAQTVDRWQQTYQQALAQYERIKTEAAQTTRQVGEQAASGITRGALWTSLLLILSACAAALGGYYGTPERRMAYE